MRFPSSIGTIAVTALLVSIATAQTSDDGKYPKFSGLWRAVNLGVGGQAAFDPTKPWGRGQQAPLTPEYQAIHEASMADQANGGQGNNGRVEPGAGAPQGYEQTRTQAGQNHNVHVSAPWMIDQAINRGIIKYTRRAFSPRRVREKTKRRPP